ncbi:membrane protein [Gordonia phage LittleMunchkin]|nr:membrane protein [Gordonia phage LittleMunchkin]
MRTFLRGITIAVRHRRIVQSGSPPLYWQLLLGAIISGVLQLVLGAPDSVARTGESTAVDYMFMGFQLAGGLIALAALYIADGSQRHAERLYWSLSFEAFGLVILTTSIVVYTVAVVYNNGGPPTANATWALIMFAIWSMRTRMPQIVHALRDLKS